MSKVMEKREPTPGPWEVQYTGTTGYCIIGEGKHIATSILYAKDGGKANAELIAKAPAMLDRIKHAEALLCRVLESGCGTGWLRKDIEDFLAIEQCGDYISREGRLVRCDLREGHEGSHQETTSIKACEF